MVTTAIPAVLLAAVLGAGQEAPGKTHSFRVAYEDTTKPDLAPIAQKISQTMIASEVHGIPRPAPV